MPAYRLRPIVCVLTLLALLSFSPVHAQIRRLEGEWSMMLDIDYITGIASSMRGNAFQFKQDLFTDYAISRYPFGDKSTRSIGVGGSLAYRFPKSPWSGLGGIHAASFITEDDTGQVSMQLTIFSLAGEYAIGGSEKIWNTFLRAGINGSIILGRLRTAPLPPLTTTEQIVNIEQATRFGFEGEFGGRINIPDLPISAEVAAGYTNANLLGKSYKSPSGTILTNYPERALNDGANPDKTGDSNRTIDFLTIRGGLRVWF
jgi:hypothetical protein